MNKILAIAAIILLSSLSFSQQFYKSNLELAKYFYDNGKKEQLINKKSLTDNEKIILLLSVYYEFSKTDLSLEQMRDVVNNVNNTNYDDSSQIETEFGKLMKKIDDLMHQKDLSYLKSISDETK